METSLVLCWQNPTVTKADVDVARDRMRAEYRNAREAVREAKQARPWRSALHRWDALGPVDFAHRQARGALSYLQSLERALAMGL